MSLPEFLAAYRGYQQRQQEQYWHTGEIIAALRNVNGGQDGHAVSADDVFPFLLTAEQRQKKEWARIEARLMPDDEEDAG
jgi:hypothetical protein